MKVKLLTAGLVVSGMMSVYATQTAQSILTLQRIDVPPPLAMGGDDGYGSATTPASTTATVAAPMRDTAPIQLSLTPALALQSRTTRIRGLSLNIWGENPQRGFALGIVNGFTGDSAGFTWAIVNYDDSYKGVQWGVVNLSRNYFAGWQRGIVNLDCGQTIGYQSGVVNISQDFYGLQLGVVNYARKLDGLQIGLINIASNNPWFSDFPDKLTPVFPIVNWSF